MSDDERPFKPDWRVKPGELIKEAIVERGWNALDFCRLIDWRLRRFVSILEAEEPITEELAADLARVFGNSQAYWLNLQKLYDEPLPDPPNT